MHNFTCAYGFVMQVKVDSVEEQNQTEGQESD